MTNVVSSVENENIGRQTVGLSSASLLQFGGRGMFIPDYQRNQLKAGILHLSVGNFHRAHQAVYLDRLFEMGEGHDFALVGAGLLAADSSLADALQVQDCLFTVTERGAVSSNTKVVGSMVNYLRGFDNWESVVDEICNPDIKIVSLTITESGYFFDQVSGTLLVDSPGIAHDIESAGTRAPKTAYGFLYAGLKKRFALGLAPLTLLSCDNLQGNGDILEKGLLDFVSRIDAALAEEIKKSVTFPNCMVDRITPRATPDDMQSLLEDFSVIDRAPVVCEDFLQWIVEDHFASGRPPLEKVGVQFTKNVKPYEKMKLRLLNAGHSSMGYLGYLLGYRFIYEIAADKDCAEYTRLFMDSEVSPTLDDVPGIDIGAYKDRLLERFSNPHIRDQALRICSDGSGKIPVFVLPTVRDCLVEGVPIDCAALLVASWIRFLDGKDETGGDIPLEDPMAGMLRKIASESGRKAKAFLSIEAIFGDLSANDRFCESVQTFLNSLYANGARATLTALLKTRR